MGFAANQARLLALIARKSDLELEAQFITNHKMYLGNMTSGFFNMQSKLEPNSEAFRVLEARIKQLQQADKILDMHLKRIENQREAISKEVEGADKAIKDNIKNSFGLMGRG
jgi:septal ring factor EnvC (AmiA/AmiB activator)